MRNLIASLAIISCLLIFNTAYAGGPYIWVSNAGSDTVSKVDTCSDTVAATISVGDYPFGVAVAQDYVYVANRNSKTVSKISRADDAVVANIELDRYPLTLALGADGYIYVLAAAEYTGTSNFNIYLYKVDQVNESVSAVIYLRPMSGRNPGIGVNRDNMARTQPA